MSLLGCFLGGVTVYPSFWGWFSLLFQVFWVENPSWLWVKTCLVPLGMAKFERCPTRSHGSDRKEPSRTLKFLRRKYNLRHGRCLMCVKSHGKTIINIYLLYIFSYFTNCRSVLFIKSPRQGFHHSDRKPQTTKTGKSDIFSHQPGVVHHSE